MDLSAVGNVAQASKKDASGSGSDVVAGGGSWDLTENGGVVIRVQMQPAKKNDKDYPGFCPDKVYSFTSMGEAASFLGSLQKGSAAPSGGVDHQGPPPSQGMSPSESRFPAPAPIPSSDDSGY